MRAATLIKIILLMLFLLGMDTTLLGAAQTSQPAEQDRAALCLENDISPEEAWEKGWPCFQITPVPSSKSPAFSSEPSAAGIQAVYPSLADYTYLVFSSLRDGNYEIYGSMTPWGEDGILAPTRMTNNSARDERPSLRPGTTQIAFSSTRTGNWDIFLMDWGGGNLKQLTFSKGFDGLPAWSPDGKKIAFVSEIDGNLEIALMNPDGSGMTRLTNNASADNYPSWSHDGNHIVWVRASPVKDYYVLYTMNADGSNQIAITGNLYWAENPQWSKDGAQITFDYDQNGDGYVDLVRLELSTYSIHKIVGEIYKEDYLSGPWSGILSKEILFTRLAFPSGGGFNACVGVINIATNAASCLAYSYLDFWPDAAPVDISVPETHVLPLPEYMRFGDGVTVVGRDDGLAGIYALYLQSRVGADGTWQNLDMSLYQTQHTFTYLGPTGDTVYFRSSGLDWAEHLEPYPAGDGDAQSMVYTWQLGGRVINNRGFGIPDAQATTTPVLADQANADAYGRFHRFVPSSPVSVTLDSPGYGALPDTRLSSLSDLAYTWALPPQDNCLVNGDFEAGLEGWTLLGIPAALETEDVHSGAAAVILGITQTITTEMTAYNGEDIAQSLGAAISQKVVITDTLHQPTLSFSMFGEQTGTGSEFDLHINDTLVYSTTTVPTTWEHTWLDMTPWSGQVVTVTFSVSNDLELGQLQVYLDDISLGSWLAPVIDQVIPAQIDSSLPITLTITGENFIITPTVQIGETLFSELVYVDEHTLQVTIPGGLSPGMYEVRVINPGGQAGVWQARLQVGELLYLPTVWKN